ncbi:MAG: UDP-N-acetylmuramoyl-L-alanyl-D-glutamate--2,6-diaminopimelate ligase [Thermodesulforhabdaceae bacterium]
MMTLSDLLAHLNALGIGTKLVKGSQEEVITGITTDSRTVKKGELFVAIKGTHTDGHLFVPDATRNGATAVMVERSWLEAEIRNPSFLSSGPNPAVITVEDTHKAVAFAASAFYGFPTEKLHLTGVTGTNGKTTTTILIEAIYRQAGFEVGRIGTIGYCWKKHLIQAPLTTPDPIMLQRLFAEMVTDGVDHVVMEVSSHALSQKRIFGCFYDVAVFTNLSHDHLDFHKTMESYFEAKSLLFLEHLGRRSKSSNIVTTSPSGCAVINIDDPYGAQLSKMLEGRDIKILTYGISNPAKIAPLKYKCCPDGSFVSIKTPVGEVSIDSRLLGRLNVYNILAAVGAGIAHGIDLDVIAAGISSVSGVDGRLQKVPIDAPFHVIVDYAHTPDAMEKALSCIREWAPGRIITVFGCGGDRDPTKRPLMAKVATDYSDVVIVTSDNPRTEDPQKIIEDILAGIPPDWVRNSLIDEDLKLPKKIFSVVIDRRTAIKKAIQIARDGDVVFIGGKGHETYQIIGRERIPFDDRCVAKECYSELKKACER